MVVVVVVIAGRAKYETNPLFAGGWDEDEDEDEDEGVDSQRDSN